MAKQERIRIVTPTAECQWAHVVKPDTQYKPEGKFKIELIFEVANATHLALLRQLRDIHNKNKKTLAASNKPCEHKPWAKLKDSETQLEDNNRYVVKFQSAYKPYIVDARGNKWPEDALVGNGSKIKVSFTPSAYCTGKNSGTTLYLNGVQVIDLVPYQEANMEDMGFSVEEGFDIASHYTDQGTEGFDGKDDFQSQRDGGCSDPPEDTF